MSRTHIFQAGLAFITGQFYAQRNISTADNRCDLKDLNFVIDTLREPHPRSQNENENVLSGASQVLESLLATVISRGPPPASPESGVSSPLQFFASLDDHFPHPNEVNESTTTDKQTTSASMEWDASWLGIFEEFGWSWPTSQPHSATSLQRRDLQT